MDGLECETQAPTQLNKRLNTHINLHYADPFLKWAGSKRKLLHHILPLVPRNFDRYFEPFLGGGSLFFCLGPKKAHVSDVSDDLINTYCAVRDNVSAVIRYLRPLKQNKRDYYRIRKNMSSGRFKRAAQFIYLNKTCWNGLYRVNTSGEFNVPYGRPKSRFVFDHDNLKACAKLLRRKQVLIRKKSYAEVLELPRKTDFVFLDPPYVTTHNMNGFLEWNETIFSWEDQLKLAKIARNLVQKGVNVLISNANHKDILELYNEFNYKQISRYSTLASNRHHRTAVTEALFFSGPDY